MKINATTARKLVSGRAEILLRITLSHSVQYRVKSHIFINPDRLQGGRIIIPRLGTPEYNHIVEANKMLTALTAYLTDALLSPKCTARTSADVQQMVDNYYRPVDTDTEWWSSWHEWERQTKVSEQRRRRYKVVSEDLKRYEDYRGKNLTIQITATDVLHFEQFLRQEHTWNKNTRPRGTNVICSIIAVLRTFINWCRRTQLITSDPFIGYETPKEVYGTPYYLTLDERDKIADTDFGSTHLNHQRDVFVFQCLVGCRVGDLLRLQGSNVHNGVLEYIPHKTMESNTTVIRVPLNERAQAIVDKYAAGPEDKLLPFISSQKYNDTIKVLCMRAGIDRMITILNPITRQEERKALHEVASSHMARRTFIGNLYQQVQDPNLIGSMSGHAEGSKAFSRYRTIDENVKRKIVELIK